MVTINAACICTLHAIRFAAILFSHLDVAALHDVINSATRYSTLGNPLCGLQLSVQQYQVFSGFVSADTCIFWCNEDQMQPFYSAI